MRVIHPFEPIADENSKVLILGSLPSPKSREVGFYYGHPQNRFWRVLSAVLDEPLPTTVEEKTQMLRRHGIALWDAIAECDITNAADSSVRNAVPNDIASLVRRTGIKHIVTNGKKSAELYLKHSAAEVGIEPIMLPSTSPANAAYSLDGLIAEYGIIRKLIGD